MSDFCVGILQVLTEIELHLFRKSYWQGLYKQLYIFWFVVCYCLLVIRLLANSFYSSLIEDFTSFSLQFLEHVLQLNYDYQK